MLANTMVVVVVQHYNVSNEHVYPFQLAMLYVNYIFIRI